MTQQTAPRSIDQYLRQLREALAGEDNALVQDALYDAEEYLRAELAAAKALTPPQSEADMLERIASTYGAPEEVAAAYRTTEAKVTAALRLPPPLPKQTAMGRFFSVYSDSRTWGALFYLLLAMFTGIFYFTVAAAGVLLSVGFAILIVGVPFFLLFIGFTRVLSLAEGRLVEGLLGVRMPRRPLTRPPGTWWERIKDMLGDGRTWTTLIYMGLQLPLGIFYFIVSIVGLTFSLALLGLPFGALFNHGEMVFGNINGVRLTADFHGWEFVLVPLLGVLLLTALMHAMRGLGQLHGKLAKALLVSRTAD
jgi:hypothetical protein